jgi:hypothetical protein
MGLLSRNPKIGIEEFCREFYDSQIFHTIIAGTDVWSGFLETVFKSVSEADPSFAAIDSNLFRQEMTAVRMEIFALAWRDKFEHDKHTIPQSIFTRRYLEENGRLDIWDIMGEYNQAIAQSAHMTESWKPIDERSWMHINKLRTDMFVKWAEANVGDPNSMTKEDEENANCVARVGNRIGADIRRADCIAVKRLAARLADRLGCDIDIHDEALFRLETVIFGFYAGAKEAIKSVNLQV